MVRAKVASAALVNGSASGLAADRPDESRQAGDHGSNGNEQDGIEDEHWKRLLELMFLIRFLFAIGKCLSVYLPADRFWRGAAEVGPASGPPISKQPDALGKFKVTWILS